MVGCVTVTLNLYLWPRPLRWRGGHCHLVMSEPEVRGQPTGSDLAESFSEVPRVFLAQGLHVAALLCSHLSPQWQQNTCGEGWGGGGRKGEKREEKQEMQCKRTH